MTWNLWWRFGPWERREAAILETLRRERPDVIGLQEVWQTGEGANLAGRLADELGMHWAWAPGEAFPHWRAALGDDLPAVGNAVLSRWPIVETAVDRLPVAGGPPEIRTALFALIEAEGGVRVPFFTTHLHSAQGGSAVRVEQVRALARHVWERRGTGPFPPVVTGDFNAEPESDEVRLFGGTLTTPAVRGQVMLDAWRAADPAAPWATWDPVENPHVAGPAGFRARIDYIHVGLPGPDRLGLVTAARRAADAPVDGVFPSDHMAVVAELIG
ncbi:endonuclease/exonuclease/phosphatase family protein [Streptomyces radicis]|uniref:Endonuclease n=1 Tax=Streptomyces radicis TaxID=1750517 RepID=A0A3A9WLQ7_9ACTN|nr:endonuclease/exonuclease/phosphatase family protein [Streptomyces radicis]RKN07087.1 endonuclease [Streptomyces radicis]RKN15137.1 endonuclease [Streptomyces radicis]